MIRSQVSVPAFRSFWDERSLNLDGDQIGMIPSAKFEYLLRLIWSSPIFGDSFPPNVSRLRQVLSQIETLYPLFVNALGPVLSQGMPLLSTLEIDKLVQQIASRIILSCSAIAAGEISDTEQLRAATTTISLIFWADQSMDAGDEVMLAAVPLLNGNAEKKQSIITDVSSALVQARLGALRWIEREVESLSRLEDRPTLLACGLQETLQNDYRKRELSRRYGLQPAKDFWAAHTAELIESLLATAATLHATAVMYAVYRQRQPELPGVTEIFQEQAVMELLRGPYNASIRIFDDLSDRLKDSRHLPAWGEFNLNIFNQPEPSFLRAFLNRASLSDERLVETVLEAFQTGTDASRDYIVQVFMELLRDRFASLPTSLSQRYEVFLQLAKRVMETAYVDFTRVDFMSDPESPLLV